MKKPAKILSITLAVLVAIVAIAWWPVKSYLINQYGEMALDGAKDLIMIRLGLKEEWREPFAVVEEEAAAQPPIELDGNIVPFRQIGHKLGERAIDRNYSIMRGGTVFDANGDGRLDLYLTGNQRPFGKQTTEEGLLTDQAMPAHPNVLFLNQGNDADGDPVFVSIQELLKTGNRTNSRDELLIENKYVPRDSVEQDELGMGRIGWGAVSADFNADGRVDLYVLNGHFGIMLQTEELGLPVYPAPNNLGREARREPVTLRMFPFVRSPIEDGLKAQVDYGAGTEAEGRNTLYLNLGDQDGDGIPEWRDATDEAGVGGHWASPSAAVADYDRDGDLDLYVANFLDPDHWGFGMDRFAGNRNQLYKNLLAETGELKFKDVASELKVAGLHPDEDLDSSIYFPQHGEQVTISKQFVNGEQVGEEADHSWAAGFYDWSGDDWPDLVVSNDASNRLRVYENQQGRGFRYVQEFDAHTWEGCWMGMSFADLDSDAREEILLTNCGSQSAASRNTHLVVEDHTEDSITALSHINYLGKRNTMHHELLQFRPDEGFVRLATQVKLNHSPYMAPDHTDPANFTPAGRELFEQNRFADSLTGIEFAWHVPLFDVDNDGDLDVYFAGALTRGNDDMVGDWSGNPGRLLVNESRPGQFVFTDRTLEYRVLDITHMDYEHNPPRRPAPGTGWHKRDFIHVTDMGAYRGMGLDAANSRIHDLFRMHEAAFGLMTPDLNQDGNSDLVVIHVPGFAYNSLSPQAKNLKMDIAGRTLAIPAPNKIGKPPTNFEPAETFVYINDGPPRGSSNQYVKIRLRDRSGHNLYGIGAKLMINGKILRRVNIGGAVAVSVHEDLHVGLGDDALRELEITWPSGDTQAQRLSFDPPVAGKTLCIDRQTGPFDCNP